MKNKLYPEIETLIHGLDISSISDERKVALQSLVDYVQTKKKTNQAIKLNFICTHNSRRSHLSQVWAQQCLQSLLFQIPPHNTSHNISKFEHGVFLCWSNLRHILP